MMIFPSSLSRLGVYLILLFLLSELSRAADLHLAEEELARKIFTITGGAPMALDVTNRSSLGPVEADAVRRGLLTQLAALGIRFVRPEQAVARTRVWLSEDLQKYLWIAEIRKASAAPATVMISLPRPVNTFAPAQPFPMTLRKSLLWEQENQVLDAAMVEGTSNHLLILEGSQVAIYRWQDGRWQTEQTLPIAHSRPWPRDLRGRLRLARDHLFDAYLPGLVCHSTGSVPLTMSCAGSDDPWPIGTTLLTLNAFFAPMRNYFTGALSPGFGKLTAVPAFYSSAILANDKLVLATTDGEIHFLDSGIDHNLGPMGWGSDISSIPSNCGSGHQLLTSKAGDGPDALTAYELPVREPVQVTAPLGLGGEIHALWTDTGTGSPIAVSHSIETGKYEVFRITIACGQ